MNARVKVQKLNRLGALMELVVWIILSLAPEVSSAQVAGASQTVLRLDLKQAVQMALAPDQNYQLQMAQESVYSEQLRLEETRATLLPSIDVSVTEQNQVLNLGGQGLQFPIPIAGFSFPRSVGPFNIFDARIQASYNLLDLSSLRQVEAFRKRVNAAQAEVELSKDNIAFAVAMVYCAAIRADSLLKISESNVRIGESLLDIANRKESAGTGTRLDVTRSRLELAGAQQRRLAAETERTRALLELLRQVHTSLHTAVELVDSSFPRQENEISLQEAIAAGMDYRAELSVQRIREEEARLLHRSVRAESLPSVTAFADYGPQAVGANTPVATHTAGLSLKIPLFDSGRRKARQNASQAGIRQEEIRSRSQRVQVELEIRQSFESLRSTKEQMRFAEESSALAQDELDQARRRYEVGVTSNLELIEAQREVARAKEKESDALSNYRQAAVHFWRSMGTVQAMLQ